MTQEEKQLLLKDLCARLPYGVKVNFRSNIEVLCEVHIYQSVQTVVGESGILYDIDMPNVKPYLRPMSSMTVEETREFLSIENGECKEHFLTTGKQDWLNANHFDYRGLIPTGLALEAKEGMYCIKQS